MGYWVIVLVMEISERVTQIGPEEWSYLGREELLGKVFGGCREEGVYGCLVWGGKVSRGGYGSVWVPFYRRVMGQPVDHLGRVLPPGVPWGRSCPVHRMVRALVDEEEGRERLVYPAGLVSTSMAYRVVDHLCSRKRCCNPEHLEVVGNGVNLRRGRRVKKALGLPYNWRVGEELFEEGVVLPGSERYFCRCMTALGLGLACGVVRKSACRGRGRRQREVKVERNEEIRRRYEGGETQTALAKAYGLSQPRIWCIVHRKVRS